MSAFPSPLIANSARLGDMARAGRGLAALVGWEIDWGRNVERMPAAPQAVEPKPVMAAVLPEYQIEGASRRTRNCIDRTLFNATRRPAPVLAGDNTRAGSSQVNFSSRAQP